MSRRIKRTLSPGDRSKKHEKRHANKGRGFADFRQRERPPSHRQSGKPKRFAFERSDKRGHVEEPVKSDAEPAPLPTRVQTVVVSPDEDNMRVDRFLEARFPGLSFSHIQRIVRKGE